MYRLILLFKTTLGLFPQLLPYSFLLAILVSYNEGLYMQKLFFVAALIISHSSILSMNMDSLQKDQMQQSMEASCALKKEINEATALLVERQLRLLDEAEVYLYKKGTPLSEDTESLHKGLAEVFEIEDRIKVLEENYTQSLNVLELPKKN